MLFGHNGHTIAALNLVANALSQNKKGNTC
jgi:hypothetical protein